MMVWAANTYRMKAQIMNTNNGVLSLTSLILVILGQYKKKNTPTILSDGRGFLCLCKFNELQFKFDRFNFFNLNKFHFFVINYVVEFLNKFLSYSRKISNVILISLKYFRSFAVNHNIVISLSS